MKTMNCKQLGGACDKEFHADTFEEIAEMSKKHGMEMFQKNDELHLKAKCLCTKLLFHDSGQVYAEGISV